MERSHFMIFSIHRWCHSKTPFHPQKW